MKTENSQPRKTAVQNNELLPPPHPQHPGLSRAVFQGPGTSQNSSGLAGFLVWSQLIHPHLHPGPKLHHCWPLKFHHQGVNSEDVRGFLVPSLSLHSYPLPSPSHWELQGPLQISALSPGDKSCAYSKHKRKLNRPESQFCFSIIYLRNTGLFTTLKINIKKKKERKKHATTLNLPERVES